MTQCNVDDASADQPSIDLAAAEYVLGTLEHFEVRRFEQMLGDNAQARESLVYWEQRLGALALALDPVEPPALVWQAIATRFERAHQPEPVEYDAGPAAAADLTDNPADSHDRVVFWRSLAVAASAAALVLAAMLWLSPGSSASSAVDGQPAYASVLHDGPTNTSWMVTADSQSRRMSVLAMSNYPVPEGKMLKAWIKTKNGKPVALGAWPHTRGAHTMTVSDAAEDSLRDATEIMVSMEDADHEGDTAPRGRVMWISPVVRRTS